jgi:hypothetical protein
MSANAQVLADGFGGDRVRVNAQLIDAGSGAHLWADQFDTVDRLALVGEGRVARDHESVGEAREIGCQFVCERVCEVILRLIAAEIGEGQHDDGKALRCKRRRRVCDDWRGSVRAEEIPGPRGDRDEQRGDRGAQKRAAILTPSPIRSPSLSSTTSPK